MNAELRMSMDGGELLRRPRQAELRGGPRNVRYKMLVFRGGAGEGERRSFSRVLCKNHRHKKKMKNIAGSNVIVMRATMSELL